MKTRLFSKRHYVAVADIIHALQEHHCRLGHIERPPYLIDTFATAFKEDCETFDADRFIAYAMNGRETEHK